MGTIRRLTDLQLASIGTTKSISLTTSGYAFQISSGNRAFEATNLGSYTVYYNNVLRLGTGGIILPYGSKFWDTITDTFNLNFSINSGGVSNFLVIQEYAGNE